MICTREQLIEVLKNAPEDQEFALLCEARYYGIGCNATEGLDFVKKIVTSFYFALDCHIDWEIARKVKQKEKN